ncbi:hypothetical protein KSP39_PZI001506 [Platanthera zijinensis]|uniref:Uncharacterized protein n=1 Tax=Platanthera zijinensis TaxID=2320716 RepID=A0AAP0GFX2_9ASPA
MLDPCLDQRSSLSNKGSQIGRTTAIEGLESSDNVIQMVQTILAGVKGMELVPHSFGRLVVHGQAIGFTIKRIKNPLDCRDSPPERLLTILIAIVTYVKRVNVPTGVVGACRLDVAYEHFKSKPHMFEFVPNKEQVKAANNLLRTLPKKGGRRKVHGVPVFTADNLNIAIATADGIKWYAPYFFDKNLLDNILESSIDQHFHTLIHNRRMQRRRNIADDGFTTEVEENIDSLFEPPEVQELLDEMGHPGIPLSVISKAAEVQFLDVVDKVLLGNKWLRKATGIQPKLPYLVDSFEERYESICQKANDTQEEENSTQKTKGEKDGEMENYAIPGGGGVGRAPAAADALEDIELDRRSHADERDQCMTNRRFTFGDWFSNPRLKLRQGNQRNSDSRRTTHSEERETNQVPPNPLLPKITMVGFSMGEGSQMSRASMKKTMEELTKELELVNQASAPSGDDKDPLFVANVGDYSSVTRINLHKK